jgi:hypothetical protein
MPEGGHIPECFNTGTLEKNRPARSPIKMLDL